MSLDRDVHLIMCLVLCYIHTALAYSAQNQCINSTITGTTLL